MNSRLILNGKAAELPQVRSAVQQVRDSGIKLEVRVTYEGGDALRLAREACRDGVERLVVGGGDGSVHEALNGLLTADTDRQPALGIMPAGRANDFANACAIPADLFQALHLAVTGKPQSIDVGRANDRYFINVASAGFGTAVSAETPDAIKQLLGGTARSLMGMVIAVNFQSYQGRLLLPGRKRKIKGMVAAVSNGRRAGGGQLVAPKACIDDKLLDVLVVREFSMAELGAVINELQSLKPKGRYISYHQVPWIEVENEGKLPINLDGEQLMIKNVRFEIVPAAICLALPDDCPVLCASKRDEPLE